ncbi:MAG: hypothetical protein MK486_11070 [Gemmatimonadetes bacterium]|jgi:hypothetical protein|uniref:Uncharacterized protein n=1 Tax=uncultured Gemmatimonadales bacterium HF4000_15H13 TaxID=723618 RepID=E7C894_9BACT|nr:hypothetical protein [uncultured Gemmatimonadales bacterium HF4000_15H13]MCH2470538.1 hypothetical protein [Gemmatimonadota bacterium]
MGAQRGGRLGLVTIAWVSGLAAQTPVPNTTSVATEVEVREVTAFFLGVRSQAIASVGEELFEGLANGVALGLEAGVEFDNQYVFSIVVLRGHHADELAETSGKTWDLFLDMSRAWARGKWHLAVGPVAGYTWVDRSIYEEPASGFLAGGSAVLSREVARSLQIGLDASATWSLVGSPPFNDGLRDTDERAVGRRLRVGARITYWWSDT